jgi:hypothetical protein
MFLKTAAPYETKILLKIWYAARGAKQHCARTQQANSFWMLAENGELAAYSPP